MIRHNKKWFSALSKKVISIALVSAMTLSLAACGDKKNDQKDTQKETVTETGITTAEKISTEEPATVTTGFVEPDIDIDSGAVITTQTETVTEAAATTEAQQPQGNYTYTIYGDITISMDINIDDYITVNDQGVEYFRLYKLAGELGWLSLGQYDLEATSNSDKPSIIGPEWWSYSNGTLWTVIDFSYYWDIMGNEKAGYDHHQISNYYIQFTTLGERKPYYSQEERTSNPNHNDISIDIGRHYPDATYGVSGYWFLGSRDDIILMAYLFWYMSQHCGEAESLCEQLSVDGWGQGGGSNRISLP